MNRRTQVGFVVSSVIACLLYGGAGCGNSVTAGATTPVDDDFLFLQGGGGSTGTDNPFTSGSGGLAPIDDPGCEDQPPPLTDFQCDPYDQNAGTCEQGFGCYIYVDYPSEPCGQEIYGSTCQPEGPGEQGAPCGGQQSCAGGFVCVISGAGTQCIQLCKLSGPSGCPAGMVCEPIDVEGFGGCI